MTAIHAERVFDGERFRTDTTVLFEGGRITDLVAGAAPGAIRLAPGGVLAPGFVDVQVNGGGGVLFNDETTPEGIRRIMAAHRRFGTTGMLPTLISDHRDKIRAAVEAVEAAIAAGMPGVLGIHIEGPFLNPVRRGIHPEANIIAITEADIALLTGLGDRGATLVTLAPERIPAGLIRRLAERGARVAAGHTDASWEQMTLAIDEGLTGATHLYNAMSQMAGREPGAVGAILTRDEVFAGIISDGFHVADAALQVAFRMKGPDRLVLVTDAMPPVGTDPMQDFVLLGTPILVKNGRCSGPDGYTLGGSALDMAGAVRHAVGHMGCSLEEALRMASLTPATFLGLEHRLGRLAPGFAADLVALDDGLRVTHTWIGGAGGRH